MRLVYQETSKQKIYLLEQNGHGYVTSVNEARRQRRVSKGVKIFDIKAASINSHLPSPCHTTLTCSLTFTAIVRPYIQSL